MIGISMGSVLQAYWDMKMGGCAEESLAVDLQLNSSGYCLDMNLGVQL